MSLQLRPITLRDAQAFISGNHRHNRPPRRPCPMPGFAEWRTLRHKWATGGWPPMSRACLNCGITRAEWERAKTAHSPRVMHPCPVERPQAGWMGRQGFTTTSHAWPEGARGSALRCLHCEQTPTEASSGEHAPTYTPNPDRWQSVTHLLSSRP